MIELPEAVTFARQITTELQGKRIAAANCGNSPHKFAFYSRTPEEYAAILAGKTIGQAAGDGMLIRVPVEPGYLLVFGEGGQRILYHTGEKTLPKKYQFFARFEDGTYLTVSISGWGAALLLTPPEIESHPLIGPKRLTPLDDAFTLEYFKNLFAEIPADDSRSIKYFLVSKPKLWGIGNGCLQDILWRARIHPRRRALDISAPEQQALYQAIRSTLQQMTELGGRDTEYDLYNRPGGYPKVLDSRAVGQPCPACGAPIEKAAYLGGAIYFCPKCQE